MAKRGRPTGWDLIRRELLASDAHKKYLEAAKRHRSKPESKAKHAADVKALRDARREYGICLWCKKDAFKPFKLCPECLERAYHSIAKYARKNKKEKKQC